jgi:hypothetical protein
MKRLLAVIAFLSLTGCASIMDMIPSKWDVNQAKSITDIQQQARHFDCKGDVPVQLASLQNNIEWFDIYAKTKSTRDIAKLTVPVSKTITEFQDRNKQGPVSPIYCDLKKKIIIQQVDIVAGAVQGRF